jgi:glycosyltransferase involved in cell wall biosynthesis
MPCRFKGDIIFAEEQLTSNKICQVECVGFAFRSLFFENAFAYVCTSLNEGFALPVLEAFFFVLPVIISNQGALIKVAGGAALVFEKNEPEILFHSM